MDVSSRQYQYHSPVNRGSTRPGIEAIEYDRRHSSVGQAHQSQNATGVPKPGRGEGVVGMQWWRTRLVQCARSPPPPVAVVVCPGAGVGRGPTWDMEAHKRICTGRSGMSRYDGKYVALMFGQRWTYARHARQKCHGVQGDFLTVGTRTAPCHLLVRVLCFSLLLFDHLSLPCLDRTDRTDRTGMTGRTGPASSCRS